MVTDDIRRLIIDHANSQKITDAAKSQGMRPLSESALAKVREGICSLEEELSATLAGS